MVQSSWQPIKLLMAALFISLSFSIEVSAQAFTPDHYLTYDIKATPFFRKSVTLQDQFIGPMDFRVRRPIKLFNPAVKRHNNEVFPINNSALHYTAYDIRPSQPVNVDATVTVINQFGTFVFDKFEPTRLLVPTAKRALGRSSIFHDDEDDDDSDAVAPADHYLCYDIEPITVTTQGGFLKDQFRSRSFTTLISTRLCNPVAKEHDGKLYDIVNDDRTNHLMCFQLNKRRIFRLLTLRDQFGRRGAVAYSDDEICVPSVKLKFPDDQCEGTFPDDEGICNGFCPDPATTCLADATGACRCQSEPPPCEATTPDEDGTCNGVCPDDQVCRPDTSGEKCECQEEIKPCGPTDDGLCGGVCPNVNDACVTDITTQQCVCIGVEPTCGSTAPDDNGMCNGLCPVNLVCVPNSTLLTCECREEIQLCARDDQGTCGGPCPNADEICAPVPGTNDCACLRSQPTLCADAQPDPIGICNGECPTGETCVSTDTTCECRPQLVPCGITPDGECGGNCPEQEVCSFIPGSDICACIS